MKNIMLYTLLALLLMAGGMTMQGQEQLKVKGKTKIKKKILA